MGDHKVISTAFIRPPSSPTRKTPASKSTKSSSDQDVQAQPHTPDAFLGKRPAQTSPIDTSQHERPTRRPRTDNSEGWSFGVVAPMDDLIVKVEEMVKMLKMVVRKKDVVSDPLLACFVSAQTLLIGCTAELMSIRSTRKPEPLDHQLNKSSSTFRSITDGAADETGEKKKRKYKSKN